MDPVTNLITFKGDIDAANTSLQESKQKIASYLEGIENVDSIEVTERTDGFIIDFTGKMPVSYSPKAQMEKMGSGIGYLISKNSKPYGYFNYVGSVFIKEDQVLYRFNNYDHYLPKKPKNSLGKIEQELGHKTTPLYWDSYKQQVYATSKGMIAGLESALNGESW